MQLNRISYSQINMYMRCPRQYYHRYVLGKKEVPGVALLEGSAHHTSMQKNNLNKMAKGSELKPKVLTEIFVEDFRTRVKKEGGTKALDWREESEKGLIERAKVWHVDYIRDVAPKIHPVGVEEKFEKELDLDGKRITLSGILDLEVPRLIYDYKTAAKARTQAETDADLQLTLYALVKKVPRVGFIQFLKKATPEVGVLQSYRTANQKLYALEVVREVVQAIEAEIYPMCNPTQWNCSKRFCGFWSMCRGKYER